MSHQLIEDHIVEVISFVALICIWVFVENNKTVHIIMCTSDVFHGFQLTVIYTFSFKLKITSIYIFFEDLQSLENTSLGRKTHSVCFIRWDAHSPGSDDNNTTYWHSCNPYILILLILTIARSTIDNKLFLSCFAIFMCYAIFFIKLH